MRNLRPDPNIDAIIKTLFPNVEQYEEAQNQWLEKFSKVANTPIIERVKEGQHRQQITGRTFALVNSCSLFFLFYLL